MSYRDKVLDAIREELLSYTQQDAGSAAAREAVGFVLERVAAIPEEAFARKPYYCHASMAFRAANGCAAIAQSGRCEHICNCRYKLPYPYQVAGLESDGDTNAR